MHVALIGAELEENLAVRYLRGALELAGHTVEQLVFNSADETERIAHALVKSGAGLAGFSMVFTYRAREFAALATRARELGFAGHMIGGGHFAAFNAEQLLRDVPAFDSMACGEGEEIICALAAQRDDPGAVAGLVWRNGTDIVHNQAAVKPPDLDTLPFPPRKVPFDRYIDLPITNVLGSRGCTHACAFCSIAAWHRHCGGPRFRLRAPEQVAEEMAQLYRRGVRIFNFHDDNFFLGCKADTMARARELKTELERRGVRKIAFAVKSRPDTVDTELFAFLKSMGMFRVFLGIEAGTAESLKRLGRGQTLSDNERALNIVNRLDLHVCFNLLLLNPDSTLEDLAANVSFLRQHPRNGMNFCRTEVYAGTPLERRLRKQGRLLGDYWGWDYVIADPRAQAAFEIIFAAFWNRNYGLSSLHHVAMGVDYEHQLYGYFHRKRRDLRRRIKSFIVTVNRNTCDHLEEIIAAIDRGVADGPERRRFVETARERVETDNARLLLVGGSLLAEVRNAARMERRRRPRWMRVATAASVAASMTLVGGACEDNTYSTETAPTPTKPEPTPDSGVHDDVVTDSATPDLGVEPETAPTGDPELLKPRIGAEVLAYVASEVRPPRALRIEVWVDKRGLVAGSSLLPPPLPDPIAEEVRKRIASLTFRDAAARGKRYVVEFTADEMKKAMPKRTTSHRSEMAPKPHPFTSIPRPEMIPMPEMAPPPPPITSVPRPEMAPPPSFHSEMAPPPPPPGTSERKKRRKKDS